MPGYYEELVCGVLDGDVEKVKDLFLDEDEIERMRESKISNNWYLQKGGFENFYYDERLFPYVGKSLLDVAHDLGHFSIVKLYEPTSSVELRARLQPLLKNHVDTCLADVPGMPPTVIAGMIVDYLSLPYDVAEFKRIRMYGELSNVEIIRYELGDKFKMKQMIEECKRRGFTHYSDMNKETLMNYLASEMRVQNVKDINDDDLKAFLGTGLPAPKHKAANIMSDSKSKPKFQDMVVEAIIDVKDRKGASRLAIKNYLVENYGDVNAPALRAGMKKNHLLSFVLQLDFVNFVMRDFEFLFSHLQGRRRWCYYPRRTAFQG